MAIQATVAQSVSMGGKSMSITRTLTDEQNITSEITCPAAQAGTLSTRTSDTAGTATLADGHTITTGMMVDITWSGGFARGATVGTVSVNSVPFTGATGDVMPVGTTAIKLCPVVSTPVNFDPDNAAIESFKLDGAGQVAFRTADAEAYAFELTATDMWAWTSVDEAANPLGSTSITEIRASTSETIAKNLIIMMLVSLQ
jgi:hypothetical protein